MSTISKFVHQIPLISVVILMMNVTVQSRIIPGGITSDGGHYGQFYDAEFNRWEHCHCEAKWDIHEKCQEFCLNQDSIKAATPMINYNDECEPGTYLDPHTASCDACVCELMTFDMPGACKEFCSSKDNNVSNKDDDPPISLLLKILIVVSVMMALLIIVVVLRHYLFKMDCIKRRKKDLNRRPVQETQPPGGATAIPEGQGQQEDDVEREADESAAFMESAV